MSLREIADATKISVRFLEALEHDRPEVLPGGIFRRSFVREYARHLGLDADRLVADFVFRHGAGADEDVSSAQARGSAPNRGTLAAVAFALLLVPLLVGKAWRERRPASSAPAASQAAAPVERVWATPAPVLAETEVEREGLALTLSAKEECWVAVRADGQTVLNRVLGRGETETVQAQGEIVLSVGNAGGIEFRVDDRPGVSLGRAGEVRRNIVITRESLKSLVEDLPSARASAHSL